MVCSGELYIVFEKVSEFLSEGRGELGTTIRDDCVVYIKAFEDIV